MTAPQHRAKLKIVIVGHVDHGKSTLVGRLFHDTGSLPEGKIETIQAVCERRGMPFEWAFLMDALQAERDQGVTIDTAQIQFRTATRDYVIIDAPGHKEFLKNMVTGAASSEAALLLIDAEEGVREQSYRHGYLLHLLGVQQVAVLVNKMDLVGYSADRFGAVAEEYRDYLASLGVEPMGFIPISAREGDNIATRSRAMPWYQGPTVIKALDQFTSEPGALERPLRLPIQDVYKFDQRRILAGRIESGRLAVGDTLLFSPSNKTAKVRSIEAWSTPEQPGEAGAGRVGRDHARGADLRRARRGGIPRPGPADREQRVPRPPVLARPEAARQRQPLHAQAQHHRDRRDRAVDRARDRHGRSVLRPGRRRSSATRSPRSCCAPAACSPSTSTAPTPRPAASSWSRTSSRSAAASSRWRATPTSANRSPVGRPTSPRSGTRCRTRRARCATATRAASCGSPASRAPASRPSRSPSRRSCSPRATTSTCSTATTCARA